MKRVVLICLILSIVQIPSHSTAIRGFGGISGTVRIPISSYNYDSVYFGDITVGQEDGTQLRVMFDTSSPDFWIPSADCDWSSKWCRNHIRYDHKISQSYTDAHRNFTVEYNEQTISGRVSIDQVEVGSIVLTNKEFGEAINIPNGVYYTKHFDGVLGLGVSSDASTGTPVVEAMVEAGLLDEAVFSFLVFNSTRYEPRAVGELLIGSIEHSRYTGQMAWSKVVSEGAIWETEIEGVGMGGVVLCEGNCRVECTTSIPITVGPNSQVEKVYTLLDAKQIPGVIIRSVDCRQVDSMPSLVFTINGVDVELTPRDYVIQETMGTVMFCFLGITAYEEPQEDKWILGTPAHRPLYIVYNFGQRALGFAQAKV